MSDEQVKPEKEKIMTESVDEAKSFNDSELEDIMSEIESLESEFGGDEVLDSVEEMEDQEIEEVTAESDKEETVALSDEKIAEDIIESIDVEETPEAIMETETPVSEGDDELSSALGITESGKSDSLLLKDNDISKTSLQQTIDSEVESLLESHKPAPVVEEPAVATVETNVVSIKKKEEPVEIEKVMETKSDEMKCESSMSLNISGEMRVDLSFEISGEKVHLFIKDDGLSIELKNGTKFVVPIKSYAKAG